MIEATESPLGGVFLIEPRVFGDARGHFYESFSARDFESATGAGVTFVQDNQSRSSRGVLRGLHWQDAPHAQGKLVRVTAGAVFDVAVDLRHASPTLGQWYGVELSEENHRQLWIPAGCAHGFLVLSDSADFLYKTTDYFEPAAERAIRWDDPELAIAWPDAGVAAVVSAKDAGAGSYADWRRSASRPAG